MHYFFFLSILKQKLKTLPRLKSKLHFGKNARSRHLILEIEYQTKKQRKQLMKSKKLKEKSDFENLTKLADNFLLNKLFDNRRTVNWQTGQNCNAFEIYQVIHNKKSRKCAKFEHAILSRPRLPGDSYSKEYEEMCQAIGEM